MGRGGSAALIITDFSRIFLIYIIRRMQAVGNARQIRTKISAA
jgi:hypothetical protein